MQRAMKHMLGMGVFAVATGGQSLAADLYPAPHPPRLPTFQLLLLVLLDRILFRRQSWSGLEPWQSFRYRR